MFFQQLSIKQISLKIGDMLSAPKHDILRGNLDNKLSFHRCRWSCCYIAAAGNNGYHGRSSGRRCRILFAQLSLINQGASAAVTTP